MTEQFPAEPARTERAPVESLPEPTAAEAERVLEQPIPVHQRPAPERKSTAVWAIISGVVMVGVMTVRREPAGCGGRDGDRSRLRGYSSSCCGSGSSFWFMM
jgi:hypothetical protein